MRDKIHDGDNYLYSGRYLLKLDCIFPACIHPHILGLWWFPRRSQFHVELALLDTVDQYLPIWTECKYEKYYEQRGAIVTEISQFKFMGGTPSLSLCQAAFINEMSGQVFYNNNTM